MQPILETITPAKARKLLEANTNNRPLRYRWIDILARTITEGRWQVTHQGIAINCDGALLDGQHRLHAIVKANIAVQMFVLRGLPREAMYGIDQGKTRDVRDVAGPLGLDLDLSRNHVATARAMINGMLGTNKCSSYLTNEQIILFIQCHWEAIGFATSLCYGKCSHSTIRGVVARAWYTAKKERLEEFVEVLSNGVSESKGDACAALLHSTYNRERKFMAGASGRRTLYMKTEAALQAFLEHRHMGTLQSVKSERFPIPETPGLCISVED